jgi:hypothetical protein
MMAYLPTSHLLVVRDISIVFAAQYQLVVLVCSEDRNVSVVAIDAIAE